MKIIKFFTTEINEDISFRDEDGWTEISGSYRNLYSESIDIHKSLMEEASYFMGKYKELLKKRDSFIEAASDWSINIHDIKLPEEIVVSPYKNYKDKVEYKTEKIKSFGEKDPIIELEDIFYIVIEGMNKMYVYALSEMPLFELPFNGSEYKGSFKYNSANPIVSEKNQASKKNIDLTIKYFFEKFNDKGKIVHYNFDFEE